MYASTNAQCHCPNLKWSCQLLQLQTNFISPCPLSFWNASYYGKKADHSDLSGLLIGNGYTMTQKTSAIQLPAWRQCTFQQAMVTGKMPALDVQLTKPALLRKIQTVTLWLLCVLHTQEKLDSQPWRMLLVCVQQVIKCSFLDSKMCALISHSECSKSNLRHSDFQNFLGNTPPDSLAGTRVIHATTALVHMSLTTLCFRQPCIFKHSIH